jgi:hypothetical protein
VQRLARTGLIGLEIAILTGLILATRCSNYRDVFLPGGVYFSDADCYARMTRVRMCAERPGLVVRHHDFENYPIGTNPHTTAPLDYLILALSVVIRPFTTQPLDLAGAFISPLLAVLTGWFLWWWLGRVKFRYRWISLILYVISPILVHGAELGRPDHQSLLILLLAIATCAEWRWQTEASTAWSVLSGIAWSVSMWVSMYEPLLLFLVLVVVALVQHHIFAKNKAAPASALSFRKGHRFGSVIFVAIIILAFLVERRVPRCAILTSSNFIRSWSRTIGELQPISLLNPVWFRWAGLFVAVAPILIWLAFRKGAKDNPAVLMAEPSRDAEGRSGRPPLVIVVFLVATFGLTMWQARWAYFFVLTFAIALPALLQRIKSAGVIWIAFVISILPILGVWDEQLWPNEAELARRMERRQESMQLRELAMTLRSQEVHAFLAPWWLSPSIAYWSGEPGVAGSSHESLPGIVDTARFFLTEDPGKARNIIQDRKVSWVVAYDADRVGNLSAIILGAAVREHALCYALDRAPAQAPRFLMFSAQNTTAKLFRVAPVANHQ